MKPAFSLLEIIFAILIVAIISTVAIPKFIDTKSSALASTIKRDVVSAITAIQSYALLNEDITKIDDAISLNSSNWEVSGLKAIFKESSSTCITIEIKKDDGTVLNISIEDLDKSVCKKLKNSGLPFGNVTLY